MVTEFFKNKKTINVEKKVWEELHKIRTRKGYGRLNEVIKDLLKVRK